jgi:hypothetical protein
MFGSRVACNAPFILSPFSLLNLIILTSVLVTSVLRSWYCLALALAVSTYILINNYNLQRTIALINYEYSTHTHALDLPKTGVLTTRTISRNTKNSKKEHTPSDHEDEDDHITTIHEEELLEVLKVGPEHEKNDFFLAAPKSNKLWGNDIYLYLRLFAEYGAKLTSQKKVIRVQS